MKEFFKKLAFFLRITDEDGVLSITHIACWVVLVKIAMEPSPSIAEMGGLLVSLAMYYGKKHLTKAKLKLNQEQAEQVAKLQEQVKTLIDKTGAIQMTQGLQNFLKK